MLARRRVIASGPNRRGEAIRVALLAERLLPLMTVWISDRTS
jgi:hypothetical protein